MEEKKEIRPLAGCEIEEALGLVWDVFAEFEAADCDQEGVDEFWGRIDYEYLLQRAGDGEVRFWGAFDDGRLVGLLYVDGEYQGQGVGKNLLRKAVLDTKEQEPQLDTVTASVSAGAVPFFTAQGFEKTGAPFRVGGLSYFPMAVRAK